MPGQLHAPPPAPERPAPLCDRHLRFTAATLCMSVVFFPCSCLTGHQGLLCQGKHTGSWAASMPLGSPLPEAEDLEQLPVSHCGPGAPCHHPALPSSAGPCSSFSVQPRDDLPPCPSSDLSASSCPPAEMGHCVSGQAGTQCSRQRAARQLRRVVGQAWPLTSQTAECMSC